MSPAVPFSIAALLLGFAAFGGIWWYTHRGDASSPSGSTGGSTGGGLTGGLTGGGLTGGLTGGATSGTAGESTGTTGGFTAETTGETDGGTTGGFTAETTGGIEDSSILGSYQATSGEETFTLNLSSDSTFEIYSAKGNGSGTYTQSGDQVTLTLEMMDGAPASEEDRADQLVLTRQADGNLSGDGMVFTRMEP